MKRLTYVLIAVAVIAAGYLMSAATPIIMFGGASLIGLNIKRMVAGSGWDDEAVHHAIACGLMMFLFGAMTLLGMVHGGPLMRVIMSLGAVPAIYYFGGDLIRGVKPGNM